jgi:hypothetical protein
MIHNFKIILSGTSVALTLHSHVKAMLVLLSVGG